MRVLYGISTESYMESINAGLRGGSVGAGKSGMLFFSTAGTLASPPLPLSLFFCVVRVCAGCLRIYARGVTCTRVFVLQSFASLLTLFPPFRSSVFCIASAMDVPWD